MKYFVVDAFAEHVFGGNPAGVCVLEKAMGTELMQRIAAENNLSETAFVYRHEMRKYDLKWFTPKAEIDLCGHATLGTAYVVANFVDPEVETMTFSTLSGELTVVRKGAYFEMDFPSRMPKQIPVTQEMEEVIEKIEAVTQKDLADVAELVFAKPQMSYSAVGNLKGIDFANTVEKLFS